MSRTRVALYLGGLALAASLWTAPALATPGTARQQVAVPDQLPKGGFFRRLIRFGRSPTAASQLIKDARRDRAGAAEKLGRFFRDPQSGQLNLSQTSIYDMGRLVKVARKLTGGDKVGHRMLLRYQRYWAPRLNWEQYGKLLNMTKGLNPTQDAMIARQAVVDFFGTRGQRSPEQVASRLRQGGDSFFALLGSARPKTQMALLGRYGKALGKDIDHALLKYDLYKTKKRAEAAERAARDAEDSASTAATLTMINTMSRTINTTSQTIGHQPNTFGGIYGGF